MPRRGYARGRRAWGMDARTNERVLLRELVKDGRTGLPVTRESFEEKHPQERAPAVFDPQVLRRPTSDHDRPAYRVNWPTGPWTALYETYRPLAAHFVMGKVDATREGDRVLTAEQGAYDVSGQPSELLRALRIVAEQGSYAVTGNAATLSKASAKTRFTDGTTFSDGTTFTDLVV